jgi:uncharacterized protein YndB with AHSA1/START domain
MMNAFHAHASRVTILSMALAGLLLLGAPAGASASAPADVRDSSSNGFTVFVSVRIAATPGDVYRHLVRNVGRWWNSEHTWTGNAAFLTIEDTVGGCFCESFKSGGGARHMTIVYVEPGKVLRMSGGLGPLQEMGITGSLTWKLTSLAPEGTQGSSTRLDVTYAVGGYMAGGLGSIAGPVNDVITGQVERLRNFIEKGHPGD